MSTEDTERDLPVVSPVHPGDLVGRYEILRELGRGGMGIVFHAKDVELGREIALKCPWPHLVEDPDNRRRFLNEAKAASLISHPNVIQVF